MSSDSRRPRLLSRKSTALTTKPLGGGEEAHRRWPEGRSEQGASKAKQRPPWRDDLRVVRLLQAAPAPIHPTKPRLLSRKSTALTTKPPGGGEEAHRRWPEGRSEWGASKAKQRPPSRKIMFDFIPKNSETWA